MELINKEENIKLFMNHLQFMDDFLKNFIPVIPEKTSHYAILFELRPLKEIKTIVKNHMYFLNNSDSNIKWGLQIFHGTENDLYIKNELREIENIIYENLEISNIKNINEHTVILKSLNFWNKIIGEKLLFFQTDSMLLNFGIDNFLKYDYIGAPWAKPKDGKFIGNGGLSLRTKSKMIDILKKYPDDLTNMEDIFFSIHLDDCIVPTIEEAKKFCVEDVFYREPLGIHKPHKLSPAQLGDILSNNKKKYII